MISSFHGLQIDDDVFPEKCIDISLGMDNPSIEYPAEVTSNINNTISNQYLSPSSPTHSTSSKTSRPKKRKMTALDEIPDLETGKNKPDRCSFSAVNFCTSTCVNSTSDDCSDFAKVVANELRGMDEIQRKLAKKLIYDVLFKGSMGSLEVMDQKMQF